MSIELDITTTPANGTRLKLSVAGNDFDVTFDAAGQAISGHTSRTKPPGWPLSCKRRGDLIGSLQCESCAGKPELKLYACEVHSSCTIGKPSPGVAMCRGCNEYDEGDDKPTPGATP